MFVIVSNGMCVYPPDFPHSGISAGCGLYEVIKEQEKLLSFHGKGYNTASQAHYLNSFLTRCIISSGVCSALTK